MEFAVEPGLPRRRRRDFASCDDGHAARDERRRVSRRRRSGIGSAQMHDAQRSRRSHSLARRHRAGSGRSARACGVRPPARRAQRMRYAWACSRFRVPLCGLSAGCHVSTASRSLSRRRHARPIVRALSECQLDRPTTAGCYAFTSEPRSVIDDAADRRHARVFSFGPLRTRGVAIAAGTRCGHRLVQAAADAARRVTRNSRRGDRGNAHGRHRPHARIIVRLAARRRSTRRDGGAAAAVAYVIMTSACSPFPSN